jgi:phosphatidylglycerol:prolipoprotein diacylglycerol transferase
MLALIPFPNIDPVLVSFEIFGRDFAIHWYAIAYIAGFICAWAWMRFEIKRAQLWRGGLAPINKTQIEDIMTWMIVGTILGGRMGYVLFYNFETFIADPVQILRVWDGGMSFHGGFIGVIFAGLLFCFKNKLDPWSVGDLIASASCFGLFFGRVANFVNAELWGHPTDVPWGVSFPTQAAQDCGQALGEICGRHPSQLYEAILEGPLLFAVMLFLIFVRKWFHRPGQIIGVFFIGYGIARTIVESFRQADPQFITADNPLGHVIDIAGWGLTKGQSLSLPMIAIGILIIVIARKRIK